MSFIFGSTKMNLTSSGRALNRMDVIMPDTPTLLPAPVCPATRRCGIRARSATTGSPCPPMPSARGDAERDRQDRRRAPESLAFDDLAERDEVAAAVRNLDPDRGAARHALDADLFRRQRKREVVLEGRDLRDLHAWGRLELIRGDDGSRRVGVHRALDAELEALGGDELHRLPEFLAVAFAVPLRRRAEELRGPKHPAGRVAGGRERKDSLRLIGLLLEQGRPGHGPRRLAFGAARLPDRETSRAGFLLDAERGYGRDVDDVALGFRRLLRRGPGGILLRALEVLLPHVPPLLLLQSHLTA